MTDQQPIKGQPVPIPENIAQYIKSISRGTGGDCHIIAACEKLYRKLQEQPLSVLWWVKASERLPSHGRLLYCKTTTGRKIVTSLVKGKWDDIDLNDDETVGEWLEEMPPTRPTEQKVHIPEIQGKMQEDYSSILRSSSKLSHYLGGELADCKEIIATLSQQRDAARNSEQILIDDLAAKFKEADAFRGLLKQICDNIVLDWKIEAAEILALYPATDKKR